MLVGLMAWLFGVSSASDVVAPTSEGAHCKMPLAEIELGEPTPPPATRPAIDRRAPSEAQVATFALG